MEYTSNFDLVSESGGSTPKQPFNWGGMWCATMVCWKLPVFRQAHVNLPNNGNWQYTVGYRSRLNSEERSWAFLAEEAHCITMDDIIIIILRYPKSSHIGCLWASLHLKMQNRCPDGRHLPKQMSQPVGAEPTPQRWAISPLWMMKSTRFFLGNISHQSHQKHPNFAWLDPGLLLHFNPFHHSVVPKSVKCN